MHQMKTARTFLLAVGVFAWGLCATAGAEAAFAMIKHLPQVPHSGEKVTISFEPAAAVESALLEYQVVLPGAYIGLKDPDYAKGWNSLPMRKAASQFSAEIPAALQTHRTLVRYRIRAKNETNQNMLFPRGEDAEPKYAYFVYDGVPGWKAALEPTSADPRRSAQVDLPSEVMGQVQTYFLIGKMKDVENATWYQQFSDKEYRYTGTLMANGKVYDHVPFRARGGSWRYAMGKNMWKFNLNKGHHLQAKDDYGEAYPVKWGKLNLRSCIQQGDYGRRGEQGMYESVGFRLFNLAGVEAPRTHWVSLRIVGDKQENPGNQYRGDFWGLYLAIENEDEEFIKAHKMPAGNIYKMMFGQGELSNKEAGRAADQGDLQRFLGGLHRGAQAEGWWRQNVDLTRYYSYRSIVEAIHHYDIADGKNYDFYFEGKGGRCRVIPWDIDLTWGDQMYGGGRDPFYFALRQPNLRIEYQNRLREIRDLLFNANETGRLIDECAAIISRPGGLSIVDADRLKWDYHPIMSSRYAMRGKADPGLFYQSARTHNFAGMVTQMKEYVNHRSSYIDLSLTADPAIPEKPVIRYDGAPGYPADGLKFHVSPFGGRGGFAAIEWRIGQIDKTEKGEKPKQPGHYEITPIWESGERTEFVEAAAVPGGAVEPGKTYRTRCRMKDTTGRWSHWSDPVEFKTAERN